MATVTLITTNLGAEAVSNFGLKVQSMLPRENITVPSFKMYKIDRLEKSKYYVIWENKHLTQSTKFHKCTHPDTSSQRQMYVRIQRQSHRNIHADTYSKLTKP